jgi:hypothetical protein
MATSNEHTILKIYIGDADKVQKLLIKDTNIINAVKIAPRPDGIQKMENIIPQTGGDQDFFGRSMLFLLKLKDKALNKLIDDISNIITIDAYHLDVNTQRLQELTEKLKNARNHSDLDGILPNNNGEFKIIISKNSKKYRHNLQKIKENPLCNFKVDDEVRVINHKKHTDKTGVIKDISKCVGKDNKDKNIYNLLLSTGVELSQISEENITLKNQPPPAVTPAPQTPAPQTPPKPPAPQTPAPQTPPKPPAPQAPPKPAPQAPPKSPAPQTPPKPPVATPALKPVQPSSPKVVDPNLCNYKVGQDIHVIGTENNGKDGKVTGVVNCIGPKGESANKYNIHLNDGKDVKDVIEFSLKHPKKGIDPCTIPKGYLCKQEGDKYICTKMAGGSNGYQAKYLKYKAKYLQLKAQL